LLAKEDFLVLPFDTSSAEYNGCAIADMLIQQLRRIKYIHAIEFEPHPALERLPLDPEGMSGEKLHEAMANLIAGSRSIFKAVSDVGSVSVSGMTLHLGSSLAAIKRMIHKRSGADSISGSLQKCNGGLYLVAHVYHKGITHVCEVGSEGLRFNLSEMICDLAYKIYFNLSKSEDAIGKNALDASKENKRSIDIEKISAAEFKYPKNFPPGLHNDVLELLSLINVDESDSLKSEFKRSLEMKGIALTAKYGVTPLLLDKNTFKTKNIENKPGEKMRADSWQSFKNFTEALYYYNEYIISDDIIYLCKSKDFCIRACKAGKNYDYTFGLLYNVAMALFNENKYNSSLELFEHINDVKVHAGSLCGQALNLRYIQKFDEALEVFQKAMYIDPDLPIPWAGVGAVNMDLGCYAYDLYDRALAGLNEAIKRYPEYPYAWRFMGIVLYRRGAGLPEKIDKHSNKDIEQFKRYLYDAARRCFEYANALATKQGLKKLDFSMTGLAACYKLLGDHKRAKEILNIIGYEKNNYNKACYQSLSGDIEGAINSIKLALDENLTTRVEILFEPDLFMFIEPERLEKESRNFTETEATRDTLNRIKKLLEYDDPYIFASFQAVSATIQEALYSLKIAELADSRNEDKAKYDKHFSDVIKWRKKCSCL
jgi:hypothetical protein